jgi:hypothetical protein
MIFDGTDAGGIVVFPDRPSRRASSLLRRLYLQPEDILLDFVDDVDDLCGSRPSFRSFWSSYIRAIFMGDEDI